MLTKKAVKSNNFFLSHLKEQLANIYNLSDDDLSKINIYILSLPIDVQTMAWTRLCESSNKAKSLSMIKNILSKKDIGDKTMPFEVTSVNPYNNFALPVGMPLSYNDLTYQAVDGFYMN